LNAVINLSQFTEVHRPSSLRHKAPQGTAVYPFRSA
jgi:hypothetical protein